MAASARSNILFAFAVALLLWLLYLARDVVMLVYVSALFAVVVTPALEAMQRARIGRWHPSRAVALVVLLVVGLGALSLFGMLAFPPIFRDIRAFAQDFPSMAARLSERLHNLPGGAEVDINAIQERAASLLGGALGVIGKVAGGVFGFFSFIILTAYFVFDGERAFHWGLSLFPREYRPRLEATFIRGESRMRHWLVGQAALMLILGVTAGITFALLGVRYAIALAVITGLLNIIPIVGPLIAAVLVSLVALISGWQVMLGVIIFFIAYQQVESALLTPRIMRYSVDLPGLAVIIALSLGGTLAGIIGALVAVPTAALLAVFVDEYVIGRPEPAEAAAPMA